MKSFRNRYRLGAAAAGMALVLMAGLPAQAAELIMFEEDGCSWCRTWEEEIGVAYPKTEEAKIAPLRRVDIHAPLPEDLKSLRKANFTPTFVLWHEGREIDRLRGYPGEHFFWPMLQEMLKKLDTSDTSRPSVSAAPKS